MANETTTTEVSAAVSQTYDRTLLTRAIPFLAHDKFGQRRPLPKGGSKNIKFRRYSALAVATTPLAEGVTPNGSQLAITDVTATVNQYGNFVTVSDMVKLTNVEPVLVEAAEVLGEQAGQSLDQIYRDILVAGTNVLYANGAARTSVNTILSAAVLDKAIRTMNNNLARMHTKLVKATDGYNTNPIRPAFWAIIHPDVAYTLDGITGFISVEKYASQGPVQEGEIGAYKNIRFVMSTFAKIWAGGGATGGTSVKETSTLADVYATMVFGQDGYGISELKGEGLKNIIKALGSGGTQDPLDQRATSGWKAITVAKILNDAFMARIESAASV